MATQEDIKKEYIRKVLLMITIGALTIVGIYGIDKLSNSKQNIPQEFQSAYKQASQSGQEVLTLMNSINEKVDKINSLDLQGESQQSIDLINEAKQENKTAKDEADKLSKSLDEIKNMLEGVSGSEKAQVILEAIEIEAELVDEFLQYTNELDNFLNTLSSSIQNNQDGDTASVQRRLESVNQKKEVINSLNSKFLSKIKELNQFN